MNLSVLITSLNDYQETQLTIESIRETSPDLNVVVVDDGSENPLTLLDKSATLIRNEQRAGVAASRDIGSYKCTGDFILIIDSHMRFQTGWYEAALKAMEAGNNIGHSCTCLGLSPSNMDVSKPNGEYTGASINFYGDDRVKPNAQKQFLEGVWLPHHEGDGYPVACMMGACYLLPKDFYQHVGGLKLLKGWGHDEPFLSLKWWLAGGEVRACKGVRIGHQFKDSTPYKTANWQIWYNRMAIAHTCLPEKQAWKLISLMPNSRELTEAKQHIESDWNIILSERAYYQSIFVRDFDWFLNWFGLSFPS